MRKKKNCWPASAIASTLLLCGCATNSPQQPPVVARGVVLTPLPASVTQIDLQNSAAWQEKASSWLQKLDRFSENETAK